MGGRHKRLGGVGRIDHRCRPSDHHMSGDQTAAGAQRAGISSCLVCAHVCVCVCVRAHPSPCLCVHVCACVRECMCACVISPLESSLCAHAFMTGHHGGLSTPPEAPATPLLPANPPPWCSNRVGRSRGTSPGIRVTPSSEEVHRLWVSRYHLRVREHA